MEMKLSVEKAKKRALKLMSRGYHWGPSILQVLCEAYDLDNEDFLWTGISETSPAKDLSAWTFPNAVNTRSF
jgi:hypothetical protein